MAPTKPLLPSKIPMSLYSAIGANLNTDGEARATAGQRAQAGNADRSHDPGSVPGFRALVLQESREAQEGLAPHKPPQAAPGGGDSRQADSDEVRLDTGAAGVTAGCRERRLLAVPRGQLTHLDGRDLLHPILLCPTSSFDQVEEHGARIVAAVVAPRVLVQVALQPLRGDGVVDAADAVLEQREEALDGLS